MFTSFFRKNPSFHKLLNSVKLLPVAYISIEYVFSITLVKICFVSMIAKWHCISKSTTRLESIGISQWMIICSAALSTVNRLPHSAHIFYFSVSYSLRVSHAHLTSWAFCLQKAFLLRHQYSIHCLFSILTCLIEYSEVLSTIMFLSSLLLLVYWILQQRFNGHCTIPNGWHVTAIACHLCHLVFHRFRFIHQSNNLFCLDVYRTTHSSFSWSLNASGMVGDDKNDFTPLYRSFSFDPYF